MHDCENMASLILCV